MMIRPAGSMTDEIAQTVQAAADRAHASGRQSPLYRWMYRHRRLITPPAGGRMADWTPLRELAIAEGIVDGVGRPPTNRQMSEVWRKVCGKRRRRAEHQPASEAPARLPEEESRETAAPVTPSPASERTAERQALIVSAARPAEGPASPSRALVPAAARTVAENRSSFAYGRPGMPALPGEPATRRTQDEIDAIFDDLLAEPEQKHRRNYGNY